MRDWTEADWAAATAEFVATARWCAAAAERDRVSPVLALARLHAPCDARLAVPRSAERGVLVAWGEIERDGVQCPVDWRAVRGAWRQVRRRLEATAVVAVGRPGDRVSLRNSSPAAPARGDGCPEFELELELELGGARGTEGTEEPAVLTELAVACGLGVANTRGLELATRGEEVVVRVTEGGTLPVQEACVQEEVAGGSNALVDGAEACQWTETLLACAEAPLTATQLGNWTARVRNDARLSALGAKLAAGYVPRDDPECARLLPQRMRATKRRRGGGIPVARGGTGFLDDLCVAVRSLH